MPPEMPSAASAWTGPHHPPRHPESPSARARLPVGSSTLNRHPTCCLGLCVACYFITLQFISPEASRRQILWSPQLSPQVAGGQWHGAHPASFPPVTGLQHSLSSLEKRPRQFLQHSYRLRVLFCDIRSLVHLPFISG